MKRKIMFFALAAALCLGNSIANATPYTTLTSHEFINFTPTAGSFDTSTGLGTLSATYNPGSYSARFFFDHEIDLLETGPFFESGSASGTADSRLAWEIGIPNYPRQSGDIYSNFLNNTLGTSTSVSGDDVAMALAWNFRVDPGYTGLLSLTVTDSIVDLPGFYLTQSDDWTGNSIYLYTTLSITPDDPTVVPEPSTFVLFASALAGLGLYRRKQKNHAI